MNITQILLHLPQRMLRIAVMMGCDQYIRLVSYVSYAFSAMNANFTLYRSWLNCDSNASERGLRVYLSMRVYTNEYGNNNTLKFI